MLSFLREDDHSGTQRTANTNPSTNQAGQTGPLGQTKGKKPDPLVENKQQLQKTILADKGEYLTVATRQKQVRKHTVMLAALFGIGLLSLCFMIRKSAPEKASASNLEKTNNDASLIEAAIAQLGGTSSQLSAHMDAIVRKFHKFSDVQQVLIEELVKNPFKYEILMTGLNERADTQRESLESDGQITAQQRLVRKMRNVELLSIMRSDNDPVGLCCLIDDRVLFEGDSIRGFKIGQIGEDFVRIESEGNEIILKLSQ